MIKHEMENAFKMAVPLDVEIGLAKIGWKRIRKWSLDIPKLRDSWQLD